MKQNKYIIGVTGGVGSGKSEILRILKEDFHAKIIIADQVAHHLMEKGQINYEKIVEVFGDDILGEDGEIQRDKLGSIVFSDSKKLEKLNQITHPNVDQAILNMMNEDEKNDTSLIVCEAALLIGAKYEKAFDSLWYIYTREEVRRERLKASRGYSDEKIDSMLANQSSEDEFRKAADVVIDNSDDLESTKIQIQKKVDSIESLCYNVT